MYVCLVGFVNCRKENKKKINKKKQSGGKAKPQFTELP